MVDAVDLFVAPLGVQKTVDPVAQVVLHERVYHKLRNCLPGRRQRQSHSSPQYLLHTCIMNMHQHRLGYVYEVINNSVAILAHQMKTRVMVIVRVSLSRELVLCASLISLSIRSISKELLPIFVRGFYVYVRLYLKIWSVPS